MKSVLGYLDDSQNYALYYNKYSTIVGGYNDANWITRSTEMKLTNGYVFTVDRGAIS